MEVEEKTVTEETTSIATAEDTMAPLESELRDKAQEDKTHIDAKQPSPHEQMVETGGSADDGELDDDGEVHDDEVGVAESGDAEDGEILEDGEIASDQEGEGADIGTDDNKDRSDSSKSSPSKRHHDDHRSRSGHSKKDRHGKRRRSKEDAHKENRQKKKRRRDHGDKSDDGGWGSDGRREKSDRKRDRSSKSPGHDDDKRRRGSGENSRHHGRDQDSHRDKSRSGRHDNRGDRHEKSEKKDRERRDKNRDKQGYGDGYDETYGDLPGLYDSPSDEDYEGYDKNKMGMEEQEEYMDSMGDGDMEGTQRKNKKQQKRKKNFDRRREENGEDQPAKKKPLLQTPMEERPICKFFKEGKCQKGSDCPFNHDYQPQKRLELCKYYVQSYCKRDGCVFLHEDFPCKYYHTGSTCYQGDNCKFSHEPLTEETEIALQSVLKEREDFFTEEDWETKRLKKKGLLGDGPPASSMSDEEIQNRLEQMKSIPSIFDIQTHAPSPNKPPQMPPQGMPGPGFFPDGMPPPTSQGGPNPHFQGGPMNQNAPNRPPFMGPGMDGPPPMGMGPPPPISGPGMMGQGPPPMMAGPGMQGPPLGPPMSQAAALVGAILRAAPMLQQYRGPNQQGPNTSMPNNMSNDPRFMGPNMENVNVSVPPPGMNMGMMGMKQDGGNMMGGGDIKQRMMGDGNQDQKEGQEFSNQGQQNQPPSNKASNNRDPRKAGKQNDPRLKKNVETSENDVDMRSQPMQLDNQDDEDLRQDVDMRQEDNNKTQDDGTPTQNWDEDVAAAGGGDDEADDIEIPSHLPPKQREMFMRIRQHTMKMKREKSELFQPKGDTETKQEDKGKLEDDDKWYSSDEEEENKPSVNNINKSNETKSDATSSPSQSSFNVMQMINAIKSQPSSNNRPTDPRKQPTVLQPKLSQETVNIQSQDGDCPWRLCRVLYVKNRIPNNIDLNAAQYKNDPRVQKILKLQELESGKVIDHTKTVPGMKRSDSYLDPDEPPRIPELLDPKVFKSKEGGTPRPELAPFVDPRSGAKADPGLPRPQDPRMKPSISDPRVQNRLNVPSAIPSRSLDPRLSRQDSNSSVSSNSSLSSVTKPYDPRLARQVSGGGSPDNRAINRQSSNDPRVNKIDTPLDIGTLTMAKPADPRLSKVLDSEINSMAFQRPSGQLSPNRTSEKESSDSNNSSSKPRLDYRNDPRFKRKHISESNLSPETVGKRYAGQRKSSTEYASPLNEAPAQQEQSGYNSYNRPRPQQKPPLTKPLSVPKPDIPPPSTDISTHDILDSLQIMPPPNISDEQQQDKNLKDIFKTIDPTASPFC